MTVSFAAATRSWAVLLLVALAVLGCGRSSLDDALVTDGGIFDGRPPPTDGSRPDSGTCNPSTCTTDECPSPPPYPYPVCRVGSSVIPAYCDRGSDGTCGWHPPACGPTVCPQIVCTQIACPAGQQTDASGCPICGCNPVATQ